jgi:tetratricopeptide (TPR) repeat protein
MKNKKKLIKLGCLIIIVFVILLVMYRIESKNEMFYSIINLFLAFFIIIAYIIFKVLRPNWLLNTGKYDKAINGFNNIIKKYENKVNVKNAAVFNIALCYSRMGNFEKSDEYLMKIDIEFMNEYLKWDYFILNAMNVMLLGEDINEVETYLKRALSILKKKEFYPAEAYFYALKGNNEKCLNYIYMYLEFMEDKKVLFGSIKSGIIMDKFIYNVQNNFFLGVCYLKMNNWVLAKQYLKKACKCDYDNYFSRKSKELVEAIKF